ncbi:MAG TPA: PilZ domain-containing protein [Methylothermaceae bacterium]|nr:PilZ domain-containing protein [Methylothermaceae bacterium]
MMPMESRRDPRYPLPGLQVEIRRAGWKPAGGYQAHRLVDLSPNGLAFVSHEESLNPLDKVGFRLRIGGCGAEGRAVVCYRRAEGEGLWRYGAMFLEVTPDIGMLLQEAEVDPVEVRSVARALAEEMVLRDCRDAGERELRRRQMLLQEAVDAWLQRLRELNRQPGLTATVDRSGVLRIDGASPIAISAVPGRSGFSSDRGEYFATVFDVLEYLRGLVQKE